MHETLAELSAAAAQLIEDVARDAIAKRGRFVIALAGGETPKALYQLLARGYRARAGALGDEESSHATDRSRTTPMR